MKKKIIEHMLMFLRGLAMGAADIVPGVSGGTIALITGIYTRFIDAIRQAFGIVSRKNISAAARGRFRSIIKQVKSLDYGLILPLILGIGTAVLTMSNIIHHLMEEQTLWTYSFFFGLILGSAYFLYRQLGRIDLKISLMAMIGATASFIIVGGEPTAVTPNLFFIFFAGSIAISAMVLPGISGSFILVLLGLYELIITSIKELDIIVIAVFSTGVFTGLLFFSRALSYLLHKKRELTMGFLIGLMLGSLRLQFNIVMEHASSQSLLGALAFLILGCVIVIILEAKGRKKDGAQAKRK